MLTINKFHISSGDWNDGTGATNLLIKTAQWISAKIYYVLFIKTLQEGDTASGTFLEKRCSRICG